VADTAGRLSEVALSSRLLPDRERGARWSATSSGDGLKKWVGVVRTHNGRTENISVLDALGVKNTDDAREKGYDSGKKVSGMKRHIAVDSNGLPHAVHVTTANVTDPTSAVAMVMKEQGHLVQVERVRADAGYTGKPFVQTIQATIGAAVEVVKRSELHTFKLMPKRWVLERLFSWVEKCRRLWNHCENTLNTSLQMMVLACVAFLLRRL
jgi:transposase